jgi:hypothetical protein
MDRYKKSSLLFPNLFKSRHYYPCGDVSRLGQEGKSRSSPKTGKMENRH